MTRLGDDWVAALVCEGSDAWALPGAASALTPARARELARRWLYAAARDSERKAARVVEEAAARARYEVYKDANDVKARAVNFAKNRGGFYNQHDRSKFLRWVEGIDDVDTWAAHYDAIAEDRQRLAAGDRESERDLWKKLGDIIADGTDGLIRERASALGIEWAAPLLSLTVAMPDGSRVPWGEATVAQHEARIAMLSRHANGELETAARHRAAISAIESAGALCLNDFALKVSA